MSYVLYSSYVVITVSLKQLEQQGTNILVVSISQIELSFQLIQLWRQMPITSSFHYCRIKVAVSWELVL